MSSNTQTTAAGGQFGTVGTEPQRVTANELDVDLGNLDPTEQEIVDADEFIIFESKRLTSPNQRVYFHVGRGNY